MLFYRFSFSKGGESQSATKQWQQPTKLWYQQQTTDFLLHLKRLQQLHNSKASLSIFTRQFQQVRRSFKKMEGLIGYFDERQYTNLNSRLQPELELEKGTYEHVEEPHGLQVIESFLEDSATYINARLPLQNEINQAIRTAQFLQQYPFTKPFSDTALAEAVSRQLLRVAAMGVTGFDKPVLEDALTESGAALQGINAMLASYGSSNIYIKELQTKLRSAITFLGKSGKDFESFDRLTFIRNYLQSAFAAAQQWKASLAHFTIPAYTSFFQKEYINQLYHYNPKAYSPEIVALGERLFNSNIMSSNQRISCATCHKPELEFADTVKLNVGFELTDTLQRNTPSLLNTVYHLRFQRDGHLLFLQDQFREVIFNHTEMGNIDESTLLRRIRKNEDLKKAFTQTLSISKDSLTIEMPLLALEAYVHSLVKTESDFDLYMQGDSSKISLAARRGFNLFMGQGKCGTCHFMPAFNGVQPPFFTKEENEVIGTLRNDNFNRPMLDKDSGLYIFTKNDLHRFSFKVPTVRHLKNAYPYMHNGSLKDLDKVLLFYNLGGGAGFMMGATVPNQTLSTQPLRMEKKQLDDIKAFLLSLE
jgi:cytochrome c peroxidase